jgi:uncharacterized short protein YbdD (DUF466 family)
MTRLALAKLRWFGASRSWCEMNIMLKEFLKRVAQAARLMVGVGDYANYVEHMRQHHPERQPMTHTEYFRYCQAARYPNKDGKIKRCPC